MSSLLTPSLYKGKAVEQQWVNSIFGTHDLFCGCPDAILHLQNILQPKNQLCLPSTTGEKEDPGSDAVDTLQDGELEKLFEEPFTEESDG